MERVRRPGVKYVTHLFGQVAVPSDFDIASVIWSNLVVASTAFVVLHIAAFVFLAGSATRAFAARARTELGEEWEQLAEEVSDPDKRKILRGVLEAIPDTVAATFAWRYATLNAIVVLNLYFLGIVTGVTGFLLSADPLFLLISIVTLLASLILSAGFMSGIFVLLFRALKVRKS